MKTNKGYNEDFQHLETRGSYGGIGYVSVDVSASATERAHKLLWHIRGGVKSAVGSALKRASNAAKARAASHVISEYTISAADFKNHVHAVEHVSSDDLAIAFKGYVIPILRFRTRYTNNGRLSTKVKKDGAQAALNHAFYARFSFGGAVVERIGDARFPVKQLYGPSAAHMLRNEEVLRRMDDTIRDTFEKRLDHEISRILNGYGKVWGGRG